MSANESGTQLHSFAAGDVHLRSGEVLEDVCLRYTVHGSLNDAGDNAILLPTFYGGTHEDVTYLIGPDRALDPGRYCIVVPNLLGNGVSSSPSTIQGDWPLVTISDNVALQQRLVTEQLGVTAVELVVGFSMGGQQAYEWASRFPEMVGRVAVLCGAARTTPHTWVFLEGVKAALLAGGSLEPGSDGAAVGKRTMSRVWAGWGLSQAWYRERRWEEEFDGTLEDYLREGDAELDGSDARDLLAMLETWQAHNVGGPDADEAAYRAAMARITAPALIMPGRTDLYFPPEDSADEVALLKHGRLAVIESVYGHSAGGGMNAEDLRFIEGEIRSLLAA
jgi:homoserine O-acetyltransferase/O-succinyltransferase